MQDAIPASQEVARAAALVNAKYSVAKFCSFLMNAQYISDQVAAKLTVIRAWRRMIMTMIIRRIGQHLLMTVCFRSAQTS